MLRGISPFIEYRILKFSPISQNLLDSGPLFMLLWYAYHGTRTINSKFQQIFSAIFITPRKYVYNP
jgi:hypothetical protein